MGSHKKCLYGLIQIIRKICLIFFWCTALRPSSLKRVCKTDQNSEFYGHLSLGGSKKLYILSNHHLLFFSFTFKQVLESNTQWMFCSSSFHVRQQPLSTSRMKYPRNSSRWPPYVFLVLFTRDDSFSVML